MITKWGHPTCAIIRQKKSSSTQMQGSLNQRMTVPSNCNTGISTDWVTLKFSLDMPQVRMVNAFVLFFTIALPKFRTAHLNIQSERKGSDAVNLEWFLVRYYTYACDATSAATSTSKWHFFRIWRGIFLNSLIRPIFLLKHSQKNALNGGELSSTEFFWM